MNVDGNATISKEYVSQTDPVDLSESNSSDPASREEESSKEVISARPNPRKNISSGMNYTPLKQIAEELAEIKAINEETRSSAGNIIAKLEDHLKE